MDDKDLTYEQKYEVPVELVLDDFHVEYADCGTHAIRVKGTTSLKHAREVHAALSQIAGIKP